MLENVTKNQKKVAYSVEEAAIQTSLSKSFIRNEIRDGNLKTRRIGRRVLILNEDLEAYLKKDDKENK